MKLKDYWVVIHLYFEESDERSSKARGCAHNLFIHVDEMYQTWEGTTVFSAVTYIKTDLMRSKVPLVTTIM